MALVSRLIQKLVFSKRVFVQDPKKILIIRSGALGDVLMTTPLIHNIREHYKDSKISYLVGNWSKLALTNNPHVDEVISFDDDIIYKKRSLQLIKLIRSLRKKRFDLCFVLDKSWHWGVFAYLTKIPCRIGFDRLGEGFAHSKTVHFDGSKYELEYNLDLARELGIPINHESIEFYLSKKDKAFAKSTFRKHKLQNQKVVVLIPGGANNPGHKMHIKRWPLHKFAGLVKKLTRSKLKIIGLGGKSDIPVVEELKKLSKCEVINLAGQTSVSQSTALMAESDCIVSPDSGPMHMAASTKKPVIALFGPTHPDRFAPKNADVFFKTDGCHNCYSIFTFGDIKPCDKKHECMENISVDKVFKSVKKCVK